MTPLQGAVRGEGNPIDLQGQFQRAAPEADIRNHALLSRRNQGMEFLIVILIIRLSASRKPPMGS